MLERRFERDVHNRVTRYQLTPQEQAQRKK
jgi:hypothetical protein